MPRPFEESERQEIREKLLSEGKRMFSVFGLKKTTVEDLAKSAGIAKGSFYTFFPSREELYLEILEREEEFRDALMVRVLLKHKDPASAMEAFLLGALDEINRNDFYRRIFDSDDMILVARKISPERMRRNREVDEKAMASFIEALQSGRNKPSINTRVLTGMLRAFILGLLHKKEIGEDIYDTVARESARALARGIFGISPGGKK